MSQVVNVITSSQKPKRPYRKGNPVSANERQKASLARRSNTHKSIHALIQIPLKEKLAQFAEEEGITQAH